EVGCRAAQVVWSAGHPDVRVRLVAVDRLALARIDLCAGVLHLAVAAHVSRVDRIAVAAGPDVALLVVEEEVAADPDRPADHGVLSHAEVAADVDRDRDRDALADRGVALAGGRPLRRVDGVPDSERDVL